MLLLVSGTPDGNDPQPVISVGIDGAPALSSQLSDHNIPFFRRGFEKNDKSFLVQPKRSCLDEIYPMFVLSLIHISEPTRLGMISYAVFCLKKKNTHLRAHETRGNLVCRLLLEKKKKKKKKYMLCAV